MTLLNDYSRAGLETRAVALLGKQFIDLLRSMDQQVGYAPTTPNWQSGVLLNKLLLGKRAPISLKVN